MNLHVGLQQEQHTFMFMVKENQDNVDKTESEKDFDNPSCDSKFSFHDEIFHVDESTTVVEEEKETDVVNSLLLVDSGSSNHISNNESKMVNIRKDFKPEHHTVQLADGTKQSGVAMKKGDLPIELRDDNGNVASSVLTDVLYIPSFPQDIFSVNRAVKAGAEITFGKNSQMVCGKTRFKIHHRDNLFYLDKVQKINVNVAKSEIVSQNPKPQKLGPQKSDSLYMWHRIMGHCNKDDVLRQEKVVNGMKITSKNDFSCESCIMGKQVKHFNRLPDEKAKNPMEFVHTDLCGPVTPEAREGFRYALSFIDDYSGATFVYFLKKKSEAKKGMLKFLADSAPYGKVKRLRRDGGGEFIDHEFKQILIDNQIKNEGTAPYSPHQNGTVERGWRTLFEMARCLLIEAQLPKYLWTYAVMAAAYIRNRCYVQRHQQTPYFMLTGKVPNISNMHVFGTICYPHKQNKSKLDPRCSKGVFLGYDKGSPAYIVFHPESNSILMYRVVTFTNQFPTSTNNGNKQTNPFLNNNGNKPTAPFPYAEVYYDDDDEDYFPDSNPRRQPVVAEVEAPVEVLEEDVEVPVVENVEVDVQAEGAGGEIDNDGNDDVGNDPDGRPRRHRNPPAYLNDYDRGDGDDENEDHVNLVRICQDFENTDFCFKTAVVVPKTYKQAIRSPDADKWKEAMDDEIDSLRENNTYDVVPLPIGKVAVGGRWVYAVKVDPGGNERFKARYVAQGFSQIEGCDYTETFAPTAKMSSVRMLMQIAVHFDLKVHHMDVKTAYLNAPIDTEIYVNQPPGYEQSSDSDYKMVCKLHKSIYGLKQSGRNWNKLFHNFLVEKGFRQSLHDACLYTYTANPHIAIVLIWVDDILMAANNDTSLNKTKANFVRKFRMNDLGPISCFLGIRFRQEEGKIRMDQTEYLQSKLVKFKMDACKPRSTPCELGGYPTDDESPYENNSLYREMVGSLIYAATCTRPDLSWVVSKLSQRLSNPRQVDFTMLKHVFRYIHGTLDKSLTFCKSKNPLKLCAYSDSDWASSPDRRSTTGYYFSLTTQGPAVSWKTRKQATVALSSCEAEYMALCDTTKEAIYLSNVLKDIMNILKPWVHEPVNIHVDNQGAIALGKNPVHHERSKHIDIRYHFTRECVTNKKILITYVTSGENTADIFTKPASRVKLLKYQKSLFGD